MSKTPSPVIFRLPQSTLTYIVLVLIIGALLLVSSNIDPRASIRAQFTPAPSITPTPLSPFASLRYVPWTSPDGLISFEQPQRWFAQANQQSGPLTYMILPPGSTNTALFVQAIPYKALKQFQNLPANPTADDYLKALMPGEPASNIRAIQVAALKGSALKMTLAADSAANRPVDLDEEVWAFSLDAEHVLLIQALAPSTDWDQMQGVLDHMRSTFKFDAGAAVSLLSQASATSTAAAPAAPTHTVPVPPTITLVPTATAAP